METKWHENIPEKGLLCKVDTGNLVKIVPCDKDGDDYYALNDGEDCISSCGDGYHHEDLTPLTAAEIMAFLPVFKPVAWGIGRDNKLTDLSAIYPRKSSAERHVDSYKNDLDFNDVEMKVIELYQLPTGDL